MTTAVFTKRYTDPDRRAAARAHHAWLTVLNTDLRLPRILRADQHSLVFEFLPGRTGLPGDLPQLAAALGRLDAAAHRRYLHAAILREPHHPPGGPRIPDFPTPRRAALARAAVDAGIPAPSIARILDRLADLPAALYKDANPRNFLLTPEGVAVVDFDDLTLAPFGYDLAKLVVTMSMTYGRLDPRMLLNAVDAYNAEIAPLHVDSGTFMVCTELHHLLTCRYLGRHGYRHPWPSVRPWPEPSDFTP